MENAFSTIKIILLSCYLFILDIIGNYIYSTSIKLAFPKISFHITFLPSEIKKYFIKNFRIVKLNNTFYNKLWSNLLFVPMHPDNVKAFQSFTTGSLELVLTISERACNIF